MTRLIGVCFVFVIAVLAACGANATPTAAPAAETPTPAAPTPTPTLTAQGVLDRARQAMGRVQSYRLTGDMTKQLAEQKGGWQFRFTGEWSAPGDYRMQMRQVFPSTPPQVVEIVSVGGRVLVSDSEYRGGAWTTEQQHEYPVLTLPDVATANLTDVRLLADEEFDNVPTYHVTGTQVLEAPQGVLTPVTTHHIYVRRDNFLVRQLTISQDFSAIAGSAPKEEDYVPVSQRAIWDFYDYNQPVTIELPDVAASDVLDRWCTALKAVKSYRFSATVVNTTGEDVQEVRLTGEWASPDRTRIRLQLAEDPDSRVYELIWVGKQWSGDQPIYQSLGPIRVNLVLSRAPAQCVTVTDINAPGLLADDVVGDIAVFHVTGKTTAARPGGTDYVTTLDLYFGKDDGLLRRFVFETDWSAAAVAPFQRELYPDTQRQTFDFYGFNEPVAIEFPQGAELKTWPFNSP